jgi:ABC-type phosphonate transport system ATPase subunit
VISNYYPKVNQQKLNQAVAMYNSKRIFIDNPTQGIDVGAKHLLDVCHIFVLLSMDFCVTLYKINK